MSNNAVDRYGNPIIPGGMQQFIDNAGVLVRQRPLVTLGAGLTATDNDAGNTTIIDTAGGGAVTLDGDVTGDSDDNTLVNVDGVAISTAGKSMMTAADAAAQTALLSVMSASTKGLVPAPAASPDATKFLNEAGAFAVPAGGASTTTSNITGNVTFSGLTGNTARGYRLTATWKAAADAIYGVLRFNGDSGTNYTFQNFGTALASHAVVAGTNANTAHFLLSDATISGGGTVSMVCTIYSRTGQQRAAHWQSFTQDLIGTYSSLAGSGVYSDTTTELTSINLVFGAAPDSGTVTLEVIP